MIIKKPSESDIAALKALWKEAFCDTDDFIDLFFNLAFTEESALAVYDNDTLVASLYWFDGSVANKKTAYIYGVATKKAHRGKGYSSALLKKTHELLKETGYSTTILVPATDGLFKFYSRLGYTECCFIDCDEHSASSEKVCLEKITAEEYLTLREGYLPSNSLIFDNKRVNFLSSITDFYRGEDFVLAISKDVEALRIIEFFGDVSRIASVVGALGFAKATVRRYGKSKPFAMYLPFYEDAPTPNYLGFAFD